MAKILLIQPPIYQAEYTARGSDHTISVLPPMGLAYIAEYLRKNGHTCEIIDGMANPVGLNEIVSRSLSFDFIGITAVSTFAKRVYEIIHLLKNETNLIAPVIVGGPHATVMPESCLENGADYVVIGEGEITMLELVNTLSAGGNVKDVNGIAFLDDKIYCRTSRRNQIENLDDIGLPARDLLPMERYRSSEARSKKQPSHSLFTSRGCTGKCSFCNKMIFGTKVRYFSVDRIVSEFFLLRNQYGAKDIAVWDDNFLANRDVAHAVCDKLIERNFNTSWSIEARIDTVDEDILVHAKEAGCDFIAYGIESGSQKVLDAMNKGITIEKIREVINMTKKIGINIRGYFMMGMPNETLEDMDQTISFAKELDIEVASFTLFVPLPGTLDYRRAQKSGNFPDPEYFMHDVYPEFNFPDKPLYVPEGMSPEQLMAKHKSAYNKYYLRPRFLIKSALDIRSYEDVVRNFNGMMNILKNAIS